VGTLYGSFFITQGAKCTFIASLATDNLHSFATFIFLYKANLAVYIYRTVHVLIIVFVLTTYVGESMLAFHVIENYMLLGSSLIVFLLDKRK
jgi:hypothetical protein